jgi:hypothetical protein
MLPQTSTAALEQKSAHACNNNIQLSSLAGKAQILSPGVTAPVFMPPRRRPLAPRCVPDCGFNLLAIAAARARRIKKKLKIL